MDPYAPFCGLPPLPAELWGRWTLDPWLIGGLLAFLSLGLAFAENQRRFAGAWALVAVLFISPLCAASMALFSARVGQHILLTLVAAPLIAFALPRLRLPPLPTAITFAALFWFWHAPGPYQATLESDLTYWTMHLSLVGTGVALIAALRAAPERTVLAAALTRAQLTVLAMLLPLAPAPWHAWHMATTLPYGLTALADQQLAGALMWVAGGALFLTLMGCLASGFLRRAETREI